MNLLDPVALHEARKTRERRRTWGAMAAVSGILILPILSLVFQSSPQSIANAKAPGCGPETGLQGQVPKKDQDSGRAAMGYCKNAWLIGKSTIGDRNSNGHLAWIDDCAYVADQGSPGDPAGLAVMDASDPRNPRLVETLPSVYHPGAAATVQANQQRRIVVADADNGGSERVVKVGRDCRDVEEVGTFRVGPGSLAPHEFQISPDGKTWYGAYLPGGVVAVDLSDLENPTPVASATFPGAIHDLDISANGKRLYLVGVDGLTIVDSSEIQARETAPTMTTISNTSDGMLHTAQLFHVDGRRYVWTNGESLSRGARGCPWAWGNIIDVTKETDPELVSTFKLAVNREKNCEAVGEDEAIYSTHFSGVDNEKNTKLLFVSWYQSGLRILDVRNPAKAREVGYYNSGTVLQTFDNAYSYVRYRPKTREVWYAGQTDGLQIVKLAKSIAPGRLH